MVVSGVVVAKQLMVECEVSNCITTRFDFHRIFVFHRGDAIVFICIFKFQGFFGVKI